MIVVDANIITYLILKGDYSEKCSKLFMGDPDWVAPRLWRDEVANVLVTYERLGRLSREDALVAFQDAERIVRGNEFDVKIDRILNVSSRTGCTGYDASYIALAEDLGLSLFTYDKKILSSAPDLARMP